MNTFLTTLAHLTALQGLNTPMDAQNAWVAKPYDTVVSHLQSVQAQHPNSTSLFQLGVNDDGTIIWGIKIGDGPQKNLVVATHHGNEYGSTELAKALVESLASDEMGGHTVYVIPVLNINGYNAGRREELLKGSRVDPNRDYPGPCKSGPSFRLKSTQALAQFLQEKEITTSSTLHTFYPGVLYPWGVSTEDTETQDQAEFIRIGKEAVSVSNYKLGNSTIELYPADGTFEDYAYWKQGAWSMLFEVGPSHNPSPAQVKEIIRGNVPGLRKMMMAALPRVSTTNAFLGTCSNTRFIGKTKRD